MKHFYKEKSFKINLHWVYYNTLYPVSKNIRDYFNLLCGLIYRYLVYRIYRHLLSVAHIIFLRLRFYFDSYFVKNHIPFQRTLM